MTANLKTLIATTDHLVCRPCHSPQIIPLRRTVLMQLRCELIYRYNTAVGCDCGFIDLCEPKAATSTADLHGDVLRHRQRESCHPLNNGARFSTGIRYSKDVYLSDPKAELSHITILSSKSSPSIIRGPSRTIAAGLASSHAFTNDRGQRPYFRLPGWKHRSAKHLPLPPSRLPHPPNRRYAPIPLHLIRQDHPLNPTEQTAQAKPPSSASSPANVCPHPAP